jgi:pyruvate dehydrogenase E2 component (dihydrolipoamide acetyltransferase)
VDELLALRTQLNAGGTERISVNDFVVKAAAKALMDVPEMNVVWSEDAVLQSPQADVAVAVASDRGLVTPVISGIENLSLSALSRTIKDAVRRANDGKLQQAELEGGTLTISNLGMYGVEEFDAIINPPQAGILAVGAAVKQPVIGDDGEITTATIVKVVLSVDHRPVDGVVGAKWLARFKELIENPIQIIV